MHWIPVAALLAISSLALPVTAQVHKCKDASGKTIYADAPCAADQSGGLIERKRTQGEIDEERMQAAEANERKYRAQAARQEAQAFEQQQQRQAIPAGGQPVVQDKSSSPECKEATKELEFVSSIRTVTQDEKRMRTNAAIAQVNAHCGSNTQLMQEPAKVIVRPAPHPVNITHCNTGFCYDDRGGVYNRSGNFMTGPSGRSCHCAGTTWNCN
ncbi:DUF4124 domain-containing protein [Acidovorax sp. Be4]|uniref:DUF4124 domain-containing protein n=1 Tax=Acidovorax bellezanensis TaxID=2976702 RepID=A0ABT2PN62_9BURK|nr:DUF4124 domain-containing protein [Acidovorax sp. Be4]MCT9811926.1 DUF4124 domain-containing protein [Acidovorax sp. Be4]